MVTSATSVDTDAEELRRDLYARVDAIAPVLEAEVPACDELRRLSDATVEALRASGLASLKLPACLGGPEVGPALQFDVFARLAYHSAPAAWCLFIYADCIGMLASHLPDAGLARYLAGGAGEAAEPPLTSGGGGLRPGTLARAEGGYRLSGSWRYGSGIHAARWLLLSGYLPGEGGERGQVLQCVVPTAEVAVPDSWHVLGLRGTGSDDYSADGVFVPDELTFPAGAPPARGGALYRAGIVGYLGVPIPAVAVGVARRALDELVGLAPSTVRGYTRPRPLAERPVFQAFVGRADQRLKAVAALMRANSEALMADIGRLGHSPPANEAETRAAAAHTTAVAAEVVGEAVRHAGGAGTRTGQVLERALRDVTMASTHLLVGDSAFEDHGQFLLGLPGADPLG